MKKVFFALLVLISLGVWAEQTVTILIDAGHGGKDPGHLPTIEGILTEKEIALSIANKVGYYLTHNISHCEVLYTRTDDSYPSLDERVEFANSKSVDYMLSIHVNGSDNPEIHGTETHIHNYDSKKSYQWASLIEHQFKNRAGRKSRGVKTGDDLGHSLQVLKYTQMPTVLVECGFITNESEAKFLNSDYGQDILASAIFRATRDMLKKNHPDIDFTPSQTAPAGDTKTDEAAKQPYFKVQIMSSVEPVELTASQFKSLEYEVERVELDGTNKFRYKYYLGPFSDKQKAKEAQAHARDHGFPDAFLVSFP